MKKREDTEAKIEKEVRKEEGQTVTLVFMPQVGQPRKKLVVKKKSGDTQDLKEVKAAKTMEAERLLRR